MIESRTTPGKRVAIKVNDEGLVLTEFSRLFTWDIIGDLWVDDDPNAPSSSSIKPTARRVV
jgi:hypothetical protein